MHIILAGLLQALKGPLRLVLDKLVPDADLKAKLEAEIAQTLATEAAAFAQAQAQVITTEVTRGSWLARNWRPLLMIFIMVLLATYGLILPLADLVTGTHVPFSPRWADVPDRLWELLFISVGGYIGGRSAEKVAGVLTQRLRR